MRTPCTVVDLAVGDLDRAAADPAFAALIADGWTTVASVVVEEATGPRIRLVMAPPPVRSRIHTSALAVMAGGLAGLVTGVAAVTLMGLVG